MPVVSGRGARMDTWHVLLLEAAMVMSLLVRALLRGVILLKKVMEVVQVKALLV